MKSIGAFEAKTHFAELLDRAAAGDVILITRRGQPVARLVPHASESEARAIAAHAVVELRWLRAGLAARNAYTTENDIHAWRAEGRR